MTIDDGEDIEAEPEARDDGAGDPAAAFEALRHTVEGQGAAVNGGVKPGHWAVQNPASTAGTQASAGRA